MWATIFRSNLTTHYKLQILGKDGEEEYQNRSRIAWRDKSFLHAEQSKIVLLKCSYGLMLILGFYYKGFGKKSHFLLLLLSFVLCRAHCFILLPLIIKLSCFSIKNSQGAIIILAFGLDASGLQKGSAGTACPLVAGGATLAPHLVWWLSMAGAGAAVPAEGLRGLWHAFWWERPAGGDRHLSTLRGVERLCCSQRGTLLLFSPSMQGSGAPVPSPLVLGEPPALPVQ